MLGDVIVKIGKGDEEALLTDKLSPILRSIPGFISSKTYCADDGEEIGIARMESREALEAWVHEGVHGSAQDRGPSLRTILGSNRRDVSRVHVGNGKRTDGNPKHLFVER